MSDNSTTPAGWYPAPHANGEQRYWDGAQWTAWTPESAAAAQRTPASPDSATAYTGVPATATATLVPAQPKKGLRWWAWVLIGVGAVLVLIIIIGSINGGRGASDDARPTAGNGGFTQESRRPTAESTVPVPNLVGLTIAEARVELVKVGVELVGEQADDWVITSQTPVPGTELPLDQMTQLQITSEAPKPVYSLAQQNAIREAQSYLEYSGFSRTGLIDQLVYEGYSLEDSTFGADNAGADWNAEAAESAADYLKYSSFSRQGLYDQLAYEGFSDAEIQFALAAVGY